MKVREIIRIIEKDGWVLARTRGSHRQFRHPVKSGTVIIAGHPSDNVHPKTERSIFNQAGIK